jgi:hypothetical protein
MSCVWSRTFSTNTFNTGAPSDYGVVNLTRGHPLTSATPSPQAQFCLT